MHASCSTSFSPGNSGYPTIDNEKVTSVHYITLSNQAISVVHLRLDTITCIELGQDASKAPDINHVVIWYTCPCSAKMLSKKTALL